MMAQSPIGETLPLREYSMNYLATPSPMATSQTSPITSPPPESASSIPISQVDVESSATLSWREITVSYEASSASSTSSSSSESPPADSSTNSRRTKVVLDGITGFAEPFRMLTIMGPSQCGKSTLLQTISGRLSLKAKYQGDIRINGRRQQLTYGTSVFLTSENSLPDFLTVKEHLHLSASLRLPKSLPRKEKLAVAEHVISEMGLTNLAYRYVRKCPYKGITEGERRVINLAVELLIGPSLIYFDDPLRGLEGAAALSLLLKLKGLSRGGSTVIMSAGHVSSHIYELLDDLCLLSAGKMIYFGDHVSALEFFSRAGFPCPPLHNPGDHFLYTIGEDFEKLRVPYLYVQDTEKAESFAVEDSQQIVQYLSTSYRNSEFQAAMISKVDWLVKKKGGVLVNRTRHPSFCLEFLTLSFRSLLNTTRALGYYWMRILLSLGLMLSLGTLFLRLDHSRSSIEARASCIFLLLEGMLFLSVGGVPYICKEIKIHKQEMTNCRYGVVKFMVANSLASLPFLLLISLVPLCSMYFLVGLHSGAFKFIYFVINLYLSLIVSESLMMLVAALVSHAYTGMVIAACIQVLLMLVAGFIRHRDRIPKVFWKFPLSYISFHAHALKGMFENEFVGTRFGGHSGAYVIYEEFHLMKHPGKWWSLVILGGIAVALRGASVLVIYLSLRVRRLSHSCFLRCN